ncbi:MAG: hypothetical protein P8076_13465 [Gammaproteobacteria bacterium]
MNRTACTRGPAASGGHGAGPAGAFFGHDVRVGSRPAFTDLFLGSEPMKLLLKVEETYNVTGRGLAVGPGPLQNEYPGPGNLSVELRKPDGAVTRAMLSLQWFFQSPPPKEPRWGCVLSGLSKSDVPVGTEVWYDPAAR